MANKTYSEKLKNPLWQRKRLEILNRDEFCCQSCFDDKSTLHVHHMHYFPNSEPWEISNDYLITLCENCHAIETENFNSNVNDLVLILKSKRLLSDGVKTLSEGLLQINFSFPPAADILKYAMENEMEYLNDKYFEHLKNNRANG